ncbi:hypothetical protein I8H89_04020 [Candidatus Saccharibacteria bacterium]|nr:hypothetical protein [Candidatus Saccharibacteria bacterium]
MSDRLIELLRKYKHDPAIAQLPLPISVRESIGLPEPKELSMMEATDAYMKASCLTATGEVIDGRELHKDVVFPEMKHVEPLESGSDAT